MEAFATAVGEAGEGDVAAGVGRVQTGGVQVSGVGGGVLVAEEAGQG
ncbi:hypothetical protein ACFWNL_34015 [Kitasatospora sp. NPDC058397]